MRVTINKPEDSIDLSQVTEKMYFVGVYKDGSALHVLSRQETDKGRFRFISVHKITRGCRFYLDGDSIYGVIMQYAEVGEVHAFHTYQEAFKFIAENL